MGILNAADPNSGHNHRRCRCLHYDRPNCTTHGTFVVLCAMYDVHCATDMTGNLIVAEALNGRRIFSSILSICLNCSSVPLHIEFHIR